MKTFKKCRAFNCWIVIASCLIFSSTVLAKDKKTDSPTKAPTFLPTKSPTPFPVTFPPSMTPTTAQPTKSPTSPPTPVPTSAPTSDQPTVVQVSSETPTNTPNTTSPTTTPPNLLGLCEGDCDTNANCADNLICYQRNRTDAIPGCEGGKADESRSDFCIDPTSSLTPTATPTNSSSTVLPTNTPTLPPTVQLSAQPTNTSSTGNITAPTATPVVESQSPSKRPQVEGLSLSPSTEFLSNVPSRAPSEVTSSLISVRIPTLEVNITLSNEADAANMTEAEFRIEMAEFLDTVMKNEDSMEGYVNLTLDILVFENGSSRRKQRFLQQEKSNATIYANLAGTSFFEGKAVSTEDLTKVLVSFFNQKGNELFGKHLQQSSNENFSSVEGAMVTVVVSDAQSDVPTLKATPIEGKKSNSGSIALIAGITAALVAFLAGMTVLNWNHRKNRQSQENNGERPAPSREVTSGFSLLPPSRGASSNEDEGNQDSADVVSMNDSSLYTTDTELIRKDASTEMAVEYDATRLDKVINLANIHSNT